MPTFSELPTDLIISCLARVPISHYRVFSFTSKTIASLLASSELWVARSIERPEENLVCCCIADRNQVPRWSSLSKRPKINVQVPRFWLSDLLIEDTYSTSRVILGMGREIYLIANEIQNSEEMRSRRLKILNCASHQWTETEPMNHGRNHTAFLLKFADKVCVLGGTQDRKSLHPEVYSPQTCQWTQIPEPDLDQDSSIILMNSTDGGQIEIWTICKGEPMKSVYNPQILKWEKSLGDLGPLRREFQTVEISDFIVRIIDSQIIVYDKDTMVWKFVNGFEEFDKQPFKAIGYGVNMLAFWDVWSESDGRKEIWCTEIALERRGDEIYAEQVWQDLIKKEENGFRFLGSTTVTL